jgi:hypothetical protein
MHWPDPPYPPGYEPRGIGLFAAAFAAVLIFVVVVFVASTSSRLRQGPEDESDMLPDAEESSRQKRNNL